MVEWWAGPWPAVLLADRASIAEKTGLDLELIKVAVRDIDKDRAFPREYTTHRLEEVVDHPDVDLVVELMGGLEPARSWYCGPFKRVSRW